MIFVATKNAGKLRELQATFAPLGWELQAFADYRDVDETGNTYEANAALKARALRDQLLAGGVAAPVLGDDSGLEVAALGNRPGVLSARYGPPGATWPERRATLLAEVAEKSRDARFVCVLHHIAANGSDTTVKGSVDGRISDDERGEGGFSYDPIFEYPPLGRTFAELTSVEKNAVSHRNAAAQALARTLL